MRLNVAIVNNDMDSPQPNLKRYLDVMGCNYTTFDYRRLNDATTLEGFDCAYLSGTGEKTWAVPSPYAAELELVRRLTIPVLGICGGHQILAQAYGGTLRLLPEPVYGRTRVARVAPTPLLDDLASEFVVFSKHQSLVDLVPEGFRVTARAAATGYVYAIEHPYEPKFGVQFHPERRNDGGKILDNFMRVARRCRRQREGRSVLSTVPPVPVGR